MKKKVGHIHAAADLKETRGIVASADICNDKQNIKI